MDQHKPLRVSRRIGRNLQRPEVCRCSVTAENLIVAARAGVN
jgi:hypothetical protein